MHAAIQRQPQNGSRTARVRDLESLAGKLQRGLSGTGKLNRRGRHWYYWFAELAAEGFTQVECASEAHAHCEWLAAGETRSVSSARRAWRDLEDFGLIRRRSFLPRGILIIDINVDRFTFYLQRNVRFTTPPCGTYTHTSVPRSSCLGDEVTSVYQCLETSNPKDVTTSSKSNKHANKKKKSFEEWSHPLVFTIGVILWGLGKKHREYMQGVTESAIAAQIEPVAFWTPERWQAMSKPYREKTARALLPQLREYAARKNSPPAKRTESPPPSRKESPPPRRKESPPPRTSLDDRELQILHWAKQNGAANLDNTYE